MYGSTGSVSPLGSCWSVRLQAARDGDLDVPLGARDARDQQEGMEAEADRDRAVVGLDRGRDPQRVVQRRLQADGVREREGVGGAVELGDARFGTTATGAGSCRASAGRSRRRRAAACRAGRRARRARRTPTRRAGWPTGAGTGCPSSCRSSRRPRGRRAGRAARRRDDAASGRPSPPRGRRWLRGRRPPASRRELLPQSRELIGDAGQLDAERGRGARAVDARVVGDRAGRRGRRAEAQQLAVEVERAHRRPRELAPA